MTGPILRQARNGFPDSAASTTTTPKIGAGGRARANAPFTGQGRASRPGRWTCVLAAVDPTFHRLGWSGRIRNWFPCPGV
jgi:hypothetical protein